jgi:hypothetical protein
VQVLRTQHQVGRKLTDQIIQFANMKNVFSLDDTQTLIKLLTNFNVMYRPHEAREDTILFPALRKIISKNEYFSLGEDFEDKEHELFGEDGFEAMVGKVAGIEKQLGIFAVFYKDYGQLPQLQPFIYGTKPVIIAVILAAIYPLAKKSLKTVELGIIGVITLILCLISINEIYVMFGAGLIALGLAAIKNNKVNSVKSFFPFSLFKLAGTGILGAGNLGIFLTFLKIGAILYGSGYVLFAFLN